MLMPQAAIAPGKFREEVDRRLVDAYELMQMLNMRSRSTIWRWIAAEKLPPPVYNRERTVALWDLDEVEKYVNHNRKED
jgi:predicted DNA-binding transcriptional regulator AlpA